MSQQYKSKYVSGFLMIEKNFKIPEELMDRLPLFDSAIQGKEHNRDFVFELAAKTFGEEVALHFDRYCVFVDTIPKSEDIFNGVYKEIPKDDISLQYSLACHLAYDLRSISLEKDGKKIKNPEKLISSMDNTLRYIMDYFCPEMIVMFARTTLALFRIPIEPTSMKHWKEFSEKYKDIILLA